jgi:hypothetical protein
MEGSGISVESIFSSEGGGLLLHFWVSAISIRGSDRKPSVPKRLLVYEAIRGLASAGRTWVINPERSGFSLCSGVDAADRSPKDRNRFTRFNLDPRFPHQCPQVEIGFKTKAVTNR